MPTTHSATWAAPRRILLATDLTDLEHTLPVAIDDATSHGADLMIAHVLAGPGAMPVDPTLLVYADMEGIAENARAKLVEAAAVAHAAGVHCSFTLLQGRVVDELLKLTSSWRADRIVAGTRGSDKFLRHILGSVSASLFHHIEIPVLAVPPNITAGGKGSATPHRILLAASLDTSGERLARFALRIAESASAEILMLHVLPNASPHHPAAVRAEAYAQKLLRDLTALMKLPRCHPTFEVGHGEAVEEIVAHAKDRKADLIILGASTHTAFDERFLPGTAYRVLCDAPCPVLVLKHDSTWETSAKGEPHEAVFPAAERQRLYAVR